MLVEFQNGRKLHARYAIKIIDETNRLLRKLPNVQEITLKNDDECIVVGDLHGHFDDLKNVISRFNIVNKQYYYVFNGDWVDRGDKQIEVLLTIFYSFILNSSHILLNRGNHEDHVQNSHPSYKPCFKTAIKEYFGKYGPIVYQKVDETFCHVPFGFHNCL